MRITLAVIGRQKAGPEATLLDDYRVRFERTGGPLGLGPFDLKETEAKGGGGMIAEATALRRAIPADAIVVAMDERGKQMSSPDFARDLAERRDGGCRDLCFIIGGADGLDAALRDSANARLSFGRMVWPHLLVRVMLAEQLYRAASILSGSPYHRV